MGGLLSLFSSVPNPEQNQRNEPCEESRPREESRREEASERAREARRKYLEQVRAGAQAPLLRTSSQSVQSPSIPASGGSFHYAVVDYADAMVHGARLSQMECRRNF
ncbi:unnamed protein product [Durusdinium trenchii]|uniref:Uncharacterized protein n=2 Tax=Durusdinium trenchii TaxID=1381693 RepID=A0ABP0R9Z8_9DINO